MNTAETVLVIASVDAFAGALLAIGREAVKENWAKLSVTVSFGIVPADKRPTAPTETVTVTRVIPGTVAEETTGPKPVRKTGAAA